MGFNDFMNKVRHWDNVTAKWMMRHFYVLFFQIVLVFVFVFWFANIFNVIDASYNIAKSDVVEKLKITSNVNLAIIALLVLLNSFWMLFMFNAIIRITNLLKDISFTLLRIRGINRKFKR